MNQIRFFVESILYLQVLLLFVSLEISAEDSTLVRIRTDVSEVNLKINDSLYVIDNFGNQISANNWFIFSLTSGEHKFVLQYEEQHFDTTIVIAQEELIVLEYSFLTVDKTDNIAQENLSQIYITSNPDSGFITIDGKTLDILTPTFVAIQKDSVRVEVFKDGYEPLVTDLMITDIQKKQVNFILKPMEPMHLSADSLGYSLDKETPPLDLRVAETVREKYMGMAETFLIFPFAQGLIAKLALDKDKQTEANIMVGTGAVLSAGSYILSKVLSKRKRNEIKERNLEIDKQNLEIKSSNKEIELIVRKANAEQKIKWQNENADKGVVRVTENETK